MMKLVKASIKANYNGIFAIAHCPYCEQQTIFRYLESVNSPVKVTGTYEHAKAYLQNEAVLTIEFHN